MNKKIIINISIIVVLMFVFLGLTLTNKNSESKIETNKISGTVLKYEDSKLVMQDGESMIYTFNIDSDTLQTGDNIAIEYTGLLNNRDDVQTCEVISYMAVDEETDENGIPKSWLDNGIFSKYYKMAYTKLKDLSLDEKIAQLLLVRYPDSDQTEILKKYGFAGYVFFEKDFKNKSAVDVRNMMKDLQSSSKIPILTAVDEEGGEVVRVSSNSNLVKEKFKSPSELYSLGGFGKIKEDTVYKSEVLSDLGLNLNLAPVVDVSTDSSDYMYDRTLKEDTALTSTYAKTVIEASKGGGVSYTLKHFPGYGNNKDTHTGTSVDARTYDEILENDLPPFKAGIDAGAEAVLVSHNIVNAIDSKNPASLSSGVHNLLRGDLDFTGIVITDDIAMSAVSDIDDVAVKALTSGNDLIITTDYEESFNSIKRAVNNGSVSEGQIDRLAFRVLAWKYYKLLMLENQK